MGKLKKYGPGFLITAAFIGPGTVTTASLAGAQFGYSLLWTMIIATIAAIILQEMAGRVALVTGRDVAQALIEFTEKPALKYTFKLLAFVAIIIGCAAYEAGNIVGGALGLEILSGRSRLFWAGFISGLALLFLLWRSYKVLEKFLMGLVAVMGFSFLLTAIIVKPDLSALFSGLIPRIPKGSITLVLGLIGTTIVPYNFFLYSSSVIKKWGQTQPANSLRNQAGTDPALLNESSFGDGDESRNVKSEDLTSMRRDLVLSVGLGGIISSAIIVTSAVAYFLKAQSIQSPGDLALQLEPLFGKITKISFGIGLFAAGLSSALTAPYAASWTAAGLFGWREKDRKFTAVSAFIVLFGMFVALLAIKPLELIVLAQVANGILLPVLILFLIYLLNSSHMKQHRNTPLQNAIAFIIFLFVLFITVKKF